jgi:adenylate cyclase
MIRRILSSKWLQFAVLFIVLCGVAFIATGNGRVNETLRNYAFDTFNRMDQRPALDKVIIVDIDENSLKDIGQWPWPRDVIAEMVLNLKAMGAKAIAFDMVFAEPDRMSPSRFAAGLVDKGLIDDETREKLSQLPDNDEILSQAFKQAGNVVTGFTYARKGEMRLPPAYTKQILMKRSDEIDIKSNVYDSTDFATNIDKVIENIAGNGSFIAAPDYDGRIRNNRVLVSWDAANGSALYPTLGLEALRVAHDRREHIKIGQVENIYKGLKSFLSSSQFKDYTVRVGTTGYDIPIRSDGKIYLKFRDLDRDRDYVSAIDIIQNKSGVSSKIQDKIVLIGTSAEGLRDIRNTAIQAFVPGVEVHFNFIEQVMQGIYLFRDSIVSGQIELYATLVFGLIIILLSLATGPIILTGVTSIMIGGLYGGTFYLYKHENLLFDPVNPSLAIAIIFIVAALMNYLRSELSKREIRDAFGLYISPDFMEELTDNPDKLSLGGEMRELTVMFTDIRNFTTISESMPPSELIVTMNDFLTPMSDVVMNRRGTIDKYMGDAMMAFWNAPLDDANHARNAVQAALDMKDALEPVNVELRARAKRDGVEPLQLAAGIGINTGPCAVGNMGSKQRFAYSALGDAVNLASRFEGQTKSYGLDLLIGTDTAKHVDDYAVVDIDLIQVKGKTEPVQIFTVLGDEAVAQSSEFKSFAGHHNEFIRLYRAGDFKAAHAMMQKCNDHDMAQPLHAYYEMMALRMNGYKNKTPSKWNGVYIAQSK